MNAVDLLARKGAGKRIALIGDETEVTVMFIVAEARCVGCGQCLDVCPQEAIRLADGKALIDMKRCNACGACMDVCPAGAIRQLVPQDRVTRLQTPFFAPPPWAGMHPAAPVGRWSGRQYRRRRGWRGLR